MIESTADAPQAAAGLAVALGLGLLIGVERERNKGEGPERAAAGIRTFALVSLSGALAQLVGPAGMIVAGVFVTLMAASSYQRTRTADPGLTTEVAMLAAFLLGILAMDRALLAAGAGVAVVVILASKSQLHRFTRERLTPQELHDALMLVAAAFVVLPLLPDRTIDPWNAINPRKLWILVVAVMGVSSAGYLALRLLGARLGLALAGLAGGFVSSTATIAAMADKAKASPELAPAYAGAGLLSNIATIVQLAVVLGALAPGLLVHATVPLVASGLATLVTSVLLGWSALGTADGRAGLQARRPFQPLHVLAFVAIVAAVMLFAAVVRQVVGDQGLPFALALSGLADVHAAAASAAQLAAAEQIAPHIALTAIAAALASNSLMKCLMALIRGGRAYSIRVIPGIVLMVAAFIVAMALT